MLEARLAAELREERVVVMQEGIVDEAAIHRDLEPLEREVLVVQHGVEGYEKTRVLAVSPGRGEEIGSGGRDLVALFPQPVRSGHHGSARQTAANNRMG
jgi:hypothetical protein